MFMNILTQGRTLQRCAVVAIALSLLTTLFESESQAGPLRRMRRRAAPTGYGTVYSSGYRGYTTGFVGPTYFGPSYPTYGPVGGFGPVGAFGPGYYGGYATGPAAPFPIGPARGRQYYGAQPIAPPLTENPRGFAGPAVPPRGPAGDTSASQANPQTTLDNAAFVRQLYRDNLNREPDEAGLNAWVQALDRGMTRRAAANYFLNSRDRAGAPRPPRPAVAAGPTLATPQNGPALAGPENGAPAAEFDSNEELPPRVADQSNNGAAPRARARDLRQPEEGFEF